MARRFEVYLVTLDPTVGSEIRKTRPCLVVSPNVLNDSLRTVLVAPMSSAGKPYPFRVTSSFGDIPGRILLDQLRSVDQRRLVRRLGTLDEPTADAVLNALAAMFAR